MNHRKLVLVLTLIASACGCQSSHTESQGPASTPFDHPQDVRFVDDLLVVTNTGYSAEMWRPGYLSVIDPKTATVVNRIPTSRLNPQRVIQHDDWVLVVNTGSYDFSSFDAPTTANPGSVDVLTLSRLKTAVRPDETLELEDTLVAPSDIAFLGDRSLITSSIAPKYITATLDTGALVTRSSHELRSADSLSLLSVKTWDGHFVTIDFNSDQLALISRDGDLICQVEVGRRDNEMEGAMAPEIDGDMLYVILALSGELRRVDLRQLKDGCSANIETAVSPLGQVPNHLIIRDNHAFVVHSGDNHIAQFDLSTGEEVQRWVLPVASNPWTAAISEDGNTMAVTKWAQSGVSLINLETGEFREVTEDVSNTP